MAGNTNLHAAKSAKNDEFYTRYEDIEAEMNAYVGFDPDVFRDKVVLLPCDDPEWSQFTRYFAANFDSFGLRKLISTSYALGAGNRTATEFETSSPLYDAERHERCGKLFVIDRDQVPAGHRVGVDDIRFTGYLEGDGDFRSEEVCRLRDEADVVVTNPPFSMLRAYIAWLFEGGKQFAFIGNMNAITYKEVFPLLKDNEMWLGTTHPKEFYVESPRVDRDNYDVTDSGRAVAKFGNICWFTNLDHGRRHESLILDTMAHNLRYNKKLRRKLESAYGALEYPHYDNYDAIEVPFVEVIPSDYDGVMGVPITFLDKYNPEQFEIVSFRKGEDGKDLVFTTERERVQPYFRILVRRRFQG